MDAMRLVLRQQLHPELDMHPSWLPATWPARHRRVQRLSESGQAMVGAVVQRQLGPELPAFDTPLRRLALLDGPALRRLAAYVGLAAHKPLLEARATARQLKRQAARLDEDGPEFVMRRVPPLPELRMNLNALQERPVTIGRVVVARGHRLLLGAIATEGDALVRRVQLKLPRHMASSPPTLNARQRAQLHELVLMCIVPERLKAWDWLF